MIPSINSPTSLFATGRGGTGFLPVTFFVFPASYYSHPSFQMGYNTGGRFSKHTSFILPSVLCFYNRYVSIIERFKYYPTIGISMKDNKKKVLREIHEVKCPKCGRLISALNENQFNYNIKQHMDAHQRKEEKKDDTK